MKTDFWKPNFENHCYSFFKKNVNLLLKEPFKEYLRFFPNQYRLDIIPDSGYLIKKEDSMRSHAFRILVYVGYFEVCEYIKCQDLLKALKQYRISKAFK